MTPRIMYCDDCKTYTVHHWTKAGWVCWCARVEPLDLGTRVIVSGGEVMELGPHKTSSDNESLPF